MQCGLNWHPLCVPCNTMLAVRLSAVTACLSKPCSITRVPVSRGGISPLTVGTGRRSITDGAAGTPVPSGSASGNPCNKTAGRWPPRAFSIPPSCGRINTRRGLEKKRGARRPGSGPLSGRLFHQTACRLHERQDWRLLARDQWGTARCPWLGARGARFPRPPCACRCGPGEGL
jgi:hypothetical protein